MKRTGKFWLTLLLTVLAAALLAAGMTAAAQTPAVIDSGSAGPNAAYTLYDNGVLSFEGSGNGEITKRFTKEIYPFYDRYDTVVVGDGITEVGYAVFDGAKNLKHLDLGNSLQGVNVRAFRYSGIEELTIPDTVLSVSDDSFACCANLKTLHIGKGLAAIGLYDPEASSCFAHCPALESITVDPENETFAVYQKGKELYNRKTEQVVLYAGAYTTTYAVLSGKHLGPFLFDCNKALETVLIGNGVSSIRYAFFGCTGIQDIFFTGDEAAWEKLWKTVENKDDLQSATVHLNVRYGNYGELRKSDDDNVIGDNVTWVYDAAPERKEVHFFGEGNMLSRSSPDFDHPEWGFINPVTAVIHSGVTNVGRLVFQFHENLTKALIADTVTSIESLAFAECRNLKEITMPSSVTSVDYSAFLNCNALQDVFYSGSEAQWNRITIEDTYLNAPLLDAHIHFNAKGHTPAEPVRENEVAATATAAGSYDEVIYCTQCPCELSRTHRTTDPLNGDTPDEGWKAIHLDEPFLVHVTDESVCRVSFTPTETGQYTLAGVDNPFTTIVTRYDSDHNYIDHFPSDVVFSMFNTKIVFAVDLVAGETYYYELNCMNNGTEPCFGSFVMTAKPPCETYGHTERSYTVENVTEQTCTTAATQDEVYHCLYCGYVIRSYHVTLNEPLGHRHTRTVEETEPTRRTHGFTAGTFCDDCGEWINGHEIIHNRLGAYEVIKEPTETEEGEAEIYCTVCGGKGLYAIEKLEPQEDDGGNKDNDSFLRRLANGIINFFLRLIKWLGGGKK